MKNVILLILTLLTTIDSSGQLKSQVDSLKKEVKGLKIQLKENDTKSKELSEKFEAIKNQLNDQNNRIESQTSLIDTAFDGISAQLTASSNFIGIFGIAIAIFTTGLSIYVSRMARNVNQMRLDNETLLQRSVTVKQEIEQLSETITNNTRGLYTLLRKEEANHILNRLISVPEDITNVFASLASDELDESHFLQMKEAYMQISSEPDYASIYLIQFFQHFAGKAISDPDIKSGLIAEIDTCILASFKNDIVKSTQDYFVELHRVGLENSINDINIFAKAIGRSKYNELEQVYFAVFNSLPNRQQHFLLYRLIENEQQTVLFRKKYGQLLMNYRTDNPTEEENLILGQIEALN